MTTAIFGPVTLAGPLRLGSPARQFRWDPKPDVTAYELALCLPLLLAAGQPFFDAGSAWDVLPPEARRHLPEVACKGDVG